MSESREYRALIELREPPSDPQPGDMWLSRRLGIVRVFNAHKRGQARKNRMNSFHLYHWGKPCLLGRPCYWRDNDSNATSFEPLQPDACEAPWEYIGNIFDLLPFTRLSLGAGAAPAKNP